MAQETKCLTSGAQFHIRVSSEYDHISVAVDLPTDTLEGVDEEEAEILSRLIHNQMELVLCLDREVGNPVAFYQSN
jgi:hypothetical protein